MQSPLMSFLSTMQQINKHRTPKQFGLVHRKKQDEINIRSFYLPKDYIEPLSVGFFLSSGLLKLDISRTMLTCESGIELSTSIPYQLQELSMNHN
jgi:hypothetical protein